MWSLVKVGVVAICVGLLTAVFLGTPQGETGTEPVEWNIPIEVTLTDGRVATLVCPKFPNGVRGAHGRECYLTKIE